MRIGITVLRGASGFRQFLLPKCLSLTHVVPLHRRESRENVPSCVLDEGERVRVGVAAAVEVARGESIADAAPQQRKPLPAELGEAKSAGARARGGGAGGDPRSTGAGAAG
jgi:hypothetical protein